MTDLEDLREKAARRRLNREGYNTPSEGEVRRSTEALPPRKPRLDSEQAKLAVVNSIEQGAQMFRKVLVDEVIEQLLQSQTSDNQKIIHQLNDLGILIRSLDVTMTELNQNVLLALQRRGPNDELQRDTLMKLNKYLDNWL